VGNEADGVCERVPRAHRQVLGLAISAVVTQFPFQPSSGLASAPFLRLCLSKRKRWSLTAPARRVAGRPNILRDYFGTTSRANLLATTSRRSLRFFPASIIASLEP
jgi:hypothetical protein